MGICRLCGNEGSLLKVNHREKGSIKVCRDCWTDLYEKNKMVSGTSGSGSSSSGCATCGV